MRLLFIIDPIEGLKPYKDSSVAMMRAAQKRGHQCFYCCVPDIYWEQKKPISAVVRRIQLRPEDGNWYEVSDESESELHAFSSVIMRTDPPVNGEYLYATHLLEQAVRQGVMVLNAPSALRHHQEKLSLMEFEDFAAPTLVTSSSVRLKAFHAKHRDIIIKPLDGMGGQGIFRVKEDGLNLASIIETLGENGRKTLMAQAYLPEIAQGDKRILLIDGEVVPYCLARIPNAGEVRGNLAAGGRGVAQPLTENDLLLAQTLGPVLAKRGLFLVGLDVIGSKLTEINVTSPTCFQEITQQTGFDVANLFIEAIERSCRKTGGNWCS